MDEKIARCPQGLQDIIYEFREATPRERLEMLLEFSDDLPPLPERLHAQRDAMEQVHECQSPVFLHTEITDGIVTFFLDIPREAPTVRGYAGVLAEGLNQSSPAAVLTTPEDVYTLLGLGEAITPQRLRGLHALMVYMKRQIQRIVATEE
jgi:cysteine desulfuration protein SufE